MIELEELTRVFDGKKAVDRISLRIEPGEIFGFLGPNGAGKTTTVKMLTGMILPSSGTARVAGFDVSESPQEVKRRIGYVPESGALFESLTAWEHLELISELHHIKPETARNRIEELLGLFGILEDRDQYLSRFSKGMKQKVLLAAALLPNPEVLFLDEPLNGLDANTSLVIKELLKKMAAQGKTIMFCSHILEVVERICTRIAIIDRGQIVATGTTEEIMAATSQGTLERAFSQLTGSPDAHRSSEDFLQALERV